VVYHTKIILVRYTTQEESLKRCDKEMSIIVIKKSLKCAMYRTVKFYSEIHRKKIVLESVKDKEGWREGLRRKT
jgi:hypothetical protein